MSKIKKSINHITRKIKSRKLTKAEVYDKKRRKRMSACLMILAYVLMFGAFYGFLNSHFDTKEKSLLDEVRPMTVAEREKSIIFLGSLIYRHEMGYPRYCQTQGYQMTAYPRAFQQHFKNEIAVLSTVLQERGTNLNHFLKQIGQQTAPMVQQVIEVELQELRKFIITDVLAVEQNKKPEDVVLADGADSRLTIQDVCEIVDKHAEAIMEKSPKREFKKIRELAASLD